MAGQTATLAGGCFWCLDAIFREIRGVKKVVCGYCGGRVENPTYEDVCSGTTGHAEAVQIVFDPEVISYRQLLLVFFTVHDPTALGGQGADVGSQYRSAIFYHNEGQRKTIARVERELERKGVWSRIVTEAVSFRKFWRAEERHQDYFRKNPMHPYCIVVVRPKLAKFRRMHQKLLRA